MMPTKVQIWIICWTMVLFSSAAAAVTIDTVPIGNPGNPADTEVMGDGTTGYGDVAYEYRIGKYEVTNSQYVEFLNAVDAGGTNTLRLYFDHSTHGGIGIDAGAANGAKYSVKPGRASRPVINASWLSAVRFANWLHNGQGSGDTETGAYTLGPLKNGHFPLNAGSIVRNPGTVWFLPSEDEWYKAAYHKNDGATGNYWNYATSSDTAPAGAQSPGGANSANVGDVVKTPSDVGAYLQSPSSYGTFDQAGNLYEWNESLLQQGSHFSQVVRGVRGGSWITGPVGAASSSRIQLTCDGGGNVGCSGITQGFRVAAIATVPEPSTLMMFFVAVAVRSILCHR